MGALPHFSSVKDAVMITGYSPRIKDLADPFEIRDVVSALRFGHCDPAASDIRIFRIAERNTVRLDRQSNTSAGAANLQVQVNDAALRRIRQNQFERTTIAQVIVPASIYQLAFGCPEVNVRAHLESVVRSALLSSVNSFGFQYTIVEG